MKMNLDRKHIIVYSLMTLVAINLLTGIALSKCTKKGLAHFEDKEIQEDEEQE